MKNGKKNFRNRSNSQDPKRVPRKTGSPRRYDEEYSDKSEGRGGAKNDISWYSKYPNLLLGAGQFPYPYRPNMNMMLGSVTTSETTPRTYPRAFHIPGVLSLDWVPSVGVSNYSTDPISVAAKEIYAKVRDAYSGNLDVDAPDFIMYLMSLDSIFSYIAWLKRLYRVLVAWTPDNYALPDVVLSAMGINPTEATSLRADRTNLWQVINELILQSRKFTCPALMDVFNRHYWMSDNVYTDEATINSQLYMFNLVGVYKFAEQLVPGQTDIKASGLSMVSLPGTGKVSDYYEFGVGLIQALVDWDDAYTINGYLKRAYAGVPTFTVDDLPQDQPFNPVYEPEVLMQIENSRALPSVFSPLVNQFSHFAVAQNPATNAVISNPTVSKGGRIDNTGEVDLYGYTIPPMISVRSDSPTVAMSVVATRLQAFITLESGTNGANNAVYAVHCGTEIPGSWNLWQAADPATQFSGCNAVPFAAVLGGGSRYSLDVNMLLIEQFDWHPFTYVVSIPPTDAPSTVKYAPVIPSGDTHNITTITQQDLANLHRVCLFSEFGSFN